MMLFLRFLAFPFSLVYGLVVYLRNVLYDRRILKSFTYQIPIISVGNIAVGGTGKTPIVEYLVKLLASHYKVATLSRGYGRKTKGYIELQVSHNATQVGDEPLQIKNKFPGITVAVCEDRRVGINHLLPLHDIILMDDAFQHRRVKAGLNIILFDYASLQSSAFFLPTGNLRESMSGIKRADVILITKCPEGLSTNEKQKLSNKIGLQSHQKLFLLGIHYDSIKTSDNEVNALQLEIYNVLLFTGIAKPDVLRDYLAKQVLNLKHISFADHYYFTNQDLENIMTQYTQLPEPKALITTEKDMFRIKHLEKFASMPITYIPIVPKFANLDEQQSFNQVILQYVECHKR